MEKKAEAVHQAKSLKALSSNGDASEDTRSNSDASSGLNSDLSGLPRIEKLSNEMSTLG